MNELTIPLKSNSKIPLYEQIYDYIKLDIQKGKLLYGEKLPSTRALSRYLTVSRSTVELAYEQLLSEGYIESEPCRGFFVAQIEGLYHLKEEKESPQAPVREKERYDCDFTLNGVDLKSFPQDVWRKLSREVLLDDRIELFKSGDPKGEYGFRKAICHYLYQARGVTCAPEQIIIGAGSDYILMLLGMVLGGKHSIAFEDPAYKQAYQVMRSLGYKTIGVPLDSCGIQVEKLKESGADLVYVTPSHQYPTGIVMPLKRRVELLKWASGSEGRYIIEDDYDSEFRYKGKPIPALQGYDNKEKVIYLGTFSKAIAPALRMSYMVLPRPLLDIYEEKFTHIHSTVSKVDQLIVQKFIEEGYLERHLNKTRAMYKNRHDVLIEALKPLLERCQISGEHAGVHLLLTFPEGYSEEELVLRAKKESIKVYGMSEYCIGRRKGAEKGERATILLGYANLTEDKIKEAAAQLIRCWM